MRISRQFTTFFKFNEPQHSHTYNVPKTDTVSFKINVLKKKIMSQNIRKATKKTKV
jgi:hypothetical protein